MSPTATEQYEIDGTTRTVVYTVEDGLIWADEVLADGRHHRIGRTDRYDGHLHAMDCRSYRVAPIDRLVDLKSHAVTLLRTAQAHRLEMIQQSLQQFADPRLWATRRVGSGSFTECRINRYTAESLPVSTRDETQWGIHPYDIEHEPWKLFEFLNRELAANLPVVSTSLLKVS